MANRFPRPVDPQQGGARSRSARKEGKGSEASAVAGPRPRRRPRRQSARRRAGWGAGMSFEASGPAAAGGAALSGVLTARQDGRQRHASGPSTPFLLLARARQGGPTDGVSPPWGFSTPESVMRGPCYLPERQPGGDHRAHRPGPLPAEAVQGGERHGGGIGGAREAALRGRRDRRCYSAPPIPTWRVRP
jgi:hypothetical protein